MNQAPVDAFFMPLLVGRIGNRLSIEPQLMSPTMSSGKPAGIGS